MNAKCGKPCLTHLATRKGEPSTAYLATRKGEPRPACLGVNRGGLGFAHLDAHCHLQHDPCFVAHAQAHPEQHFFCMSETPKEYETFAACGLPENATMGLGLHPWSVSPRFEDVCIMLDNFVRLLPSAWLIGEVGLDFSTKHASTKEQQLYAFRVIAEAVAGAPLPVFAPVPPASSQVAPLPDFESVAPDSAAGTPVLAAASALGKKRVLSVHAVQAAGCALDVLQETGCLNACICVFHWFSGTGEELVRARKAGCYFSFSSRALATKRSRAYAAQIPPDRLLFESDAFSLDNYPCLFTRA